MTVPYIPGYRQMAKNAAGRLPKRTPGQVDFNDPNSMQAAAQGQYATEAGQGTDATSAYLARAKAFDPSAAINQYAQGAWGSISDALKNTLRDTRGSAVGAGRYDSGFLDEDQNTVESQATKQLADAIAQQSVTGAGMTLQNNAGLAQFGQSTTQDANEMLAGEREFQANQAEQRKKDKRSKWGTIGGLLGGAAGFITGGPAGAYEGYQIGSGIGGSF